MVKRMNCRLSHEKKMTPLNMPLSPCRSLGVHFSKVRSLTLDTWEPELLKVRKARVGEEVEGKVGVGLFTCNTLF